MPEKAVHNATILCVEDDSTRKYFRRLILEQHGYKVLSASSAQRALELLLQEDPKLVLADESFGRDAGASLAAETKRLKPEVPVVLVSASGEGNAAADETLDTTVSPEKLLSSVKKCLASRPTVAPEALMPKDDPVPGFPAHSEPETLKSLLAEIVECSDDAILSKTLDGTVTSWNHAAERMYGYRAQEIVGRNVTLLLPPDRPNEIHEILLKMQRGERVDHIETKRLAKNGTILDVSLTVSPIRDRCGEIVGASTISRDITHLKAAERAIRNSEKLAVAGRMAATVAHEINNPLEALANIFYLLKQDKNLSEFARKFIQTGEEEVRRITQITHLTLGFHRDRQSTATDVNILELIENVLTLFRRKIEVLGINVEKRFASNGKIRGNSGELRQVFANLVVNAIEALSAQGDRLLIRVHDAHEGMMRGIRVLIADNGPGIPSESRRQLFEPFFTTKGPKGTGIGLWVSQGIITGHGGSIRIKSRATRKRSGTVFSIFLPYDLRKPSQKPAEVTGSKVPPLRRAS